MPNGPLALYRERLKAGELKPDPVQALAAEKLESLHHALRNYQPRTGKPGWRERLGLARRQEEPAPQGLYIFGEVGRGKSMLMDLFFETAPVERKKRVHFHAFMQSVHNRIHEWRQEQLSGARKGDADPIPPLARAIAEEAWLLCFDELQVLDIADAMILGRLFQALFDNNVVVVTTSNRAPDDLYKNGLQRELFLPFIALIKDRLDVLELNGETDYRLSRMRGVQVYHAPLGPEAETRLDAAFRQLTDGKPATPDVIHVKGRRLTVPLAADKVARFSFQDLCGKPLGPADYLAVATLYHTLILSGVPRLGPENRDQAKRFVTLIDALYEHKVNLICSAEAPPQELYTKGDGAFEFQRTVSRLMEMQSRHYLERPHLT